MLTLSYSYLVYTLQAHVRLKKFNFSQKFFFHAYTLHTCFGIHSPYSYLVYTLQAHVRFKIFKFSQKFFFHVYTLHTCFGIHSPYSYLVYTLQVHVRFKIFKFSQVFFFMLTLSTHVSGFTLHTVIWFTLQAHVRLKNFKFSQEIIFSFLHSPHMFQGSLSIQLFGLHSPSTCKVQNFQIFTEVFFFLLTLSTHVSGFTLHTVIWFTLSKHMLG